MPLEAGYLLGCGYATLGGAIAVYPIMCLMWAILRAQAAASSNSTGTARRPDDSNLQPNFWQTATIGVIERGLYVASLQIGRPEFIGLWLGIKTVAQSKTWTDHGSVPGRAIYNNFLVGNGLSILYAAIGAGIIYWTVGPSWERNPSLVLITAVVPILLSIPLGIWLRCILKRTRNHSPDSAKATR